MRVKTVGTYEVRELTVGQMLPIMSLATDNPSEFQRKMAAMSVCIDGQPVGDLLDDISFSVYMQELLPAVVEVNSMGEEKKD
jgi:hypothetical protein